MASKSFKPSRLSLSTSSSSDMLDFQTGKNRPPLPQHVTFARRTPPGRYVNYSRDDLDSELSTSGHLNHTAHTPDNQPDNNTSTTLSQKVEEQYVSSSLFTGGFNSTTRARLMDKVTDGLDSTLDHPQMADVKGSSCAINGCDGTVMRDERGDDILPCECDFKICRDCYLDVLKTGDGICPGCKEEYKATDSNEVMGSLRSLPQLPAPGGVSKVERRLSLVKSSKSWLMRSQTGDFEHNRWLFETKGTYGYGNAIWPKEGVFDNDKDDDRVVDEPSDLISKPWRPLTRKLKIPAAIISPYRLLIMVRMVVLGFFLTWRIRHPNNDAIWLWGMSVVCEVWFTFSWILDQLPKLCPINRATDLNVLKEKFETPTPNNPAAKSDLPGIDIFVSTADPEKEPPLVTANTILSILAADYPVEKLACYVSDDGGALLTFEAMAEAASFANLWVPFCRKHNVEPRNPESYFNSKKDPYKNKVLSDFVKDRRRVKREYDEFKVRINGLPESIRRRSDAYHAREELRAMTEQRQRKDDDPIEVVKIKKATWMADGTHWPGTWLNPSADHSKGDHAGIIQVFELLNKQEETRQHELAAKLGEFKALKAQAETERQRVIYDEQKKLAQQQAQVKSQTLRYEDELARKRMQAENELQRTRNQELVKMQEESSIRQEAARRATEEQIQAQRRQTEREKAETERETIKVRIMAEAEGRAHEAKLAEDVNRRVLVARVNAESDKWVAAINTTFDHIGGGLRAILTDQNKLIVAVGGVTALAAGVYTTREGARVIWSYVDRILGQPSLIRESSRGKYPWSGLFSRAMSRSSGSQNGNGFGDVILHPPLQKRIQQLSNATANTKAHQAPFRNMLFYGPPGTGKTMAARELARKSGLDYALMTGGDVAPLGSQAVTKIHQMFDWAKKSNRGLLLFIDEADAFLCERNKTYMSEAQRSALNALLFRSGDQSKDIVLALATNRPGDLDSAVADRIDEVLEFPLPGEDERFKLLELYLKKYIAEAGGERERGLFSRFFQKQQQKIEIKGLNEDIIKEAASKTEGFSGREIAKLMASVQAAVYGSEDCVLDSNLFREVVDYKVAEHQQRKKFAAGAEEGQV